MGVTHTCSVLAVVLVEFDQDWGGDHQEVSEWGGDGVGHHREALTQSTQTLEGEKKKVLWTW